MASLRTFLRILGFVPLIATLTATSQSSATKSPLYRDTTEYPPFTLSWTTSTDMKQVRAVFPSPITPFQAALATDTGLFLTTDAGRTWNHLPEATAEKVGPINTVAFHPLSPDTFYIGSQTKGVWVTTDQGKTFHQVGTRAKGMASDTVASLIVYTGDPSHQTLLAVHGNAAPGLSKSRDGGAKWDLVNTEYSFRRLQGGEGDMAEFFLIGSTVKDLDIQNIYSCSTVGEFLLELVHDVVPTDLAIAPGSPIPYQKPATLYATASDNGAYHIDCNFTGDSHDVKPLPLKDAAGWAGVGVTWGPSADILNLFLYDPSKLGLVVSHDELATTRTASNGMLVSSLVKEGAMLRTNTNGTVFYNVVNGSLSIGRVPDDVPVVELTPPAVELNTEDQKQWRQLALSFQKFSRDKGSTVAAARALKLESGDLDALYHSRQLTITARFPLKPAPPVSVTVDLSRFGGAPNEPLCDDGEHDDGAAGDGVYGMTFAFLPELHRPVNEDKEWRSNWPGRVALGVTATFADGRHTGAVGVETVYTRINDLTIWPDKESAVSSSEGGVTVETADNPREVHNGAVSLRINVPKGHWAVHFKVRDQERDITSYEAMTFWLRATGGVPPKEINLQLKDHPEFSDSSTTNPIPTLNGMVPGAEDQRVIVPISPLLSSSVHFQVDRLGEIILSGDSTAPSTLLITDLQILAHNDQAVAPAPPTPQK